MDVRQVPVVDIAALMALSSDVEVDAALRDAKDGALHKTIEEIRAAASEWGFFYIANHGLPDQEMQKFQKAMRSFFRLPKELKRTVRRTPTNSRGYVEHELTKNKTDCKECFDFAGLNEDGLANDKHQRLGDDENQWVDEETLPGFRSEMATYFGKMEYIARRLLKVFAVALGEEPAFFDQFFHGDNSSHMRLNHYPATEDPEKTMGVYHHTDAGALTILLQDDDVASLQAFHRESQTWNNVPPRKDAAEDDPEEKGDDRMHELEKILIRERFKVDLLVAQRIADANAQMKKQMLNLAAEAVDQDENTDGMSTEKAAEEELAGLFTQIETIGERLKDVKSRCFKFESVTQQQMDNIYLFLKEKIHYKQDLVAQERDISTFIFTQIHEKDEALIPLMLEWLLLESEQLRTQNQIQEHLAGPRDEGYWTQVWDETSQAFYYVNSASKESVWEPPSVGYYDINQEFQVPGLETEAGPAADAWTAATNESAEEVPYPEAGIAADSKAWEEPPAQDASAEGDLHSSETRTEEKAPTLDQASSQLDATFELKIDPNATEMIEMESVLERISREHEQERKRLELVFELEKARQKEELRKRKEKKRREKLAKKQRQKEEAFRDEAPKEDGQASAQPLPAPVTSRKAETKPEERSPLSINVPGHGRVDLSHLLSDAHATRHRQMKGITPAHERAMLNPATLRYLTEQMVIKQPEVLGQQVSLRKEIVLDEFADEK